MISRLPIFPIHWYLYYLFHFLIYPCFSYLSWSLASFCRYSCIYLMLELLYIWRLFLVLRLSVRTWGYFRPAHVRHHSYPYPRDRGVTEWYHSLGSPLVWVTTWVNARTLTNSTIRFRWELICIWSWGFQLWVQECHFIKIHSSMLFYSLISVINQSTLIFFLFSLHPMDSKSLSLTHDTNSPPRGHYRCQSSAVEASWTRNIQAPWM